MRVVLEERIFYWEEEGKRSCLLNCNKFLSNKSKIPMHSINGEIRTILDIIEELLNVEIQRGNDEESIQQMLLLDLLLIIQLMSTSKPLKVLEIGCHEGNISYHFASILGEFNKESIFYCMSDQMESEWLRRMEQVKELPHLSFLATDYEEAILEKEAFDIIFLNGEIQTKKEYQVLERTLSFLKEEGSLMVYSNGTPLLESTFQLLFKKREEYRFSPMKAVLVGKKRNRDWYRKMENVLEESIQLVKKIEIELDRENFDAELWNSLLKQVDLIIEKEMKQKNIEQKEQWLNVKERMLDYWLSYHEEEYREIFQQDLKILIKKLLSK